MIQAAHEAGVRRLAMEALPHQTSIGSPGAASSSLHRFAACSRSRMLVYSMLRSQAGSVSGVIST